MITSHSSLWTYTHSLIVVAKLILLQSSFFGIAFSSRIHCFSPPRQPFQVSILHNGRHLAPSLCEIRILVLLHIEPNLFMTIMQQDAQFQQCESNSGPTQFPYIPSLNHSYVLLLWNRKGNSIAKSAYAQVPHLYRHILPQYCPLI